MNNSYDLKKDIDVSIELFRSKVYRNYELLTSS